MTLQTVIADNLIPTAVGMLVVTVSFNRLLGYIWPFALVMPLVPVFSVAYSGYPGAVYLWSYVPILALTYLRLKLGPFPR